MTSLMPSCWSSLVFGSSKINWTHEISLDITLTNSTASNEKSEREVAY